MYVTRKAPYLFKCYTKTSAEYVDMQHNAFKRLIVLQVVQCNLRAIPNTQPISNAIPPPQQLEHLYQSLVCHQSICKSRFLSHFFLRVMSTPPCNPFERMNSSKAMNVTGNQAFKVEIEFNYESPNLCCSPLIEKSVSNCDARSKAWV